MSDLRKAAEMALEAFERLDRRGGLGLDVHEYIRTKTEALRQALAQPEQEPVAWMYEWKDEYTGWNKTAHLHKPDFLSDIRNLQPLYTAPPKRALIKLTEDEFDQCDVHETWASMYNVQAKLVEKNT